MRLIKATLGERIRGTLRTQILSGARTPGAKLSAVSLAEEFGVSVIPVREALRALQVEGLVVMEPNRSAFVRQLSVRELDEIFEVRLCLEEFAVRRAARNMSHSLLALLRSLLASMDRSERDKEEWRKQNRAFHMAIYRAADNDLLLVMIEQLWARFDPYVALYVEVLSDLGHANAEHRLLFDALLAGDSTKAAKVHVERVRSVGVALRNALAASSFTQEQYRGPSSGIASSYG